MLGLSLWEGRLPGQKTIENEDKAAMGSYRPESNFGTSDTVAAGDARAGDVDDARCSEDEASLLVAEC